MEAVQAYQASDGVLFKTADACQDYEVPLVWRNRIDEFQKSGLSPYPASPHASMAARVIAHASMAARVIVAWERFKTGG